jgi:hypothetical protein
MDKVTPSVIPGNEHVEKFLTSLDTTPCSRVGSTDVYTLKMDAEDSPKRGNVPTRRDGVTPHKPTCSCSFTHS